MTTLAALRSELEQLEDCIRELRYERSRITLDLERCLKEADRIKRHLRAAVRSEEEGAA